MTRKTRNLTHAAIFAALYAVLTHLQNMLLPGSASWAVQCRLSEALCVFAFFTNAAIPGLTVGCLLFNLSFAAAMPLDLLLGSLATLLGTGAMYLTRRVRVFGIPVVGLACPALSNALLVGWELTLYTGGAFWLNAAYVAAGELAVAFTLGLGLYWFLRDRHLDKRLFGTN